MTSKNGKSSISKSNATLRLDPDMVSKVLPNTVTLNDRHITLKIKRDDWPPWGDETWPLTREPNEGKTISPTPEAHG